MKCQHCEKPATFHITELTGPKPAEFHLCEIHAKLYLMQPEQAGAQAPTLANVLSQQLGGMSQTAEELEKLDKRACPQCGITFFEFRNQGRLGCAHDYVFFEAELEPLISNIHGATQHVGEKPKRADVGIEKQTDLIRLRKDLDKAIKREDYEQASKLRDQIRSVEAAEEKSEGEEEK